MGYPFPDDIRDPDRKSPNPFADDAQDLPHSDGPFGVSPEGMEYQPVFEQTYADRVTITLILSVLGAVTSVAGWLTFAGQGVLILNPLLSLAFSVPGMVIGRLDVQAMDAGVMAAQRRKLASRGALIGLLGLANSAAYAIVWVYLAMLAM